MFLRMSAGALLPGDAAYGVNGVDFSKSLRRERLEGARAEAGLDGVVAMVGRHVSQEARSGVKGRADDIGPYARLGGRPARDLLG